MKATCPNCQKRQSPQNTYCERCGALLHTQHFCERCGTLQQNGEKNCRKCGAPYPTQATPKESVLKRPVKLWKSALIFFFVIVALGTFNVLKSRTNRPYADQLNQQYTEWKDSVGKERNRTAKKKKNKGKSSKHSRQTKNKSGAKK